MMKLMTCEGPGDDLFRIFVYNTCYLYVSIHRYIDIYTYKLVGLKVGLYDGTNS